MFETLFIITQPTGPAPQFVRYKPGKSSYISWRYRLSHPGGLQVVFLIR